MPPCRWRLRLQQLRALLAKRFLSARRDRLALVTQLAAPWAAVLLALYVSSMSVRIVSEPLLPVR